MQIHGGDDYELPWGVTRSNFYSVTGYPTAYFDGVDRYVGGYAYDAYHSAYNARRAVATDVTLWMTAETGTGQTYDVEVQVGIEQGGQGKTMRVYIVQVLDHWPNVVSYSRNGFKQAASTVDVTLSPGEQETIERTFTLDADSWNHLDDVKIIAWAQEPLAGGPAEVYQAAISGSSEPPPPVETGTLSIETIPFNGEVFVDGESWGQAPQSRDVAVGEYTVSFGGIPGFTTPDDQQVTVAEDETTEVVGEYTEIQGPVEKGTLAVDTVPVQGPISVNGTSWGLAPQSRDVLPGEYTVSFGPAQGFVTPADEVVIVHAEETTSVQGTYVPDDAQVETGTLMIDTTPIKAEVFIEGFLLGEAPLTLMLPAGTYTVGFADVDGYTTPEEQQVTVQAGAIVTVTGTYAEEVAGVGTLSITTTPVAGRVCVDGVCWGEAPQSYEVAGGSYTVTFEPVEGYYTPGSRVVTVVEGHTTNVGGKYERHKGTLTVITKPIDGMVIVDGKNWGEGTQSRSVTVGDHTVSFATVGGYETPADEEVSVQVDATTTVTGKYVLKTGTLSIETTPISGQVVVDGESWGVAPQERDIAIGVHVVRFVVASSYLAPESQEVVIELDEMTHVVGEYTRIVRSLTIDSEPVKGEVFVDGESWGMAPQTRDVPLGEHSVRFGAIADYSKPAGRSVAVLDDNLERRVVGVYSELSGTLEIDTAPFDGEIFVDGESWGVAPQHNKLPIGEYTVRFGDVTGYVTPAEQQVLVTQGEITTVVGSYLQAVGTLSIETTPVSMEVFVDGESWGMTPQSRATKPGEYTVSFGSVGGYIRPDAQTVVVTVGEERTVSGEYLSSEAAGRELPLMPTPCAAAPAAGALLFALVGLSCRRRCAGNGSPRR